MSKVGGDNREGGDPGSGPMASVHELDVARERQQQSVSRPPKGPQDSPTPDRAAALNMLGTFDLDGIDVPSPDEVLATFEGSAAAGERTESTKHARPEGRLTAREAAAVHDVHSDEILRELEEHHRRGQPTARPSAPRGSADLRLGGRPSRPRPPRRSIRKETRTASRRMGRHGRATLLVAALVPLTIALATVWLSQVGGTAARAPSRTSSSRLAAAEITPFISAKIFDPLTRLFAGEARGLARHHVSPGEHPPLKRHTKKRATSRRVVRQAAATRVLWTTPTDSASASSSSSSAPTSSAQSATSQPAPAVTTQTTEPAFGQNGTLGPGRGAPGTQ